jgi:hypothetical protein
MVSIWWVVVAFVVGGYAGAVLVALMSMAGAPRETARVRPLKDAAHARSELARRRRHAHGRHESAAA